MGYIQVQFYQNDFNNNYCGGVARADKVKQMLSRTSKGWQWQKGLDKGWQVLAWSNKGKHMLARKIHSENIEYNKIIMTYSLQIHCLSQVVIECTYS